MSPREESTMDHPRIEEEGIVDRYLAGRLPDEDEADFEEHLFACSACLTEVEAGEQMRRGLREVAVEDTARAVVAAGLGARLLGRPWARRGARVALTLLLAALPFAAWRIAVGPASPTGDLQLVALGVTRDGEVPEVRPRPDRDTLLLSLELPPPTPDRCRVELRDAAGRVLWQGDGLEPNFYDTVMVALPSGFLAPGTYEIRVIDASRPESPARTFPFRVTDGSGP